MQCLLTANTYYECYVGCVQQINLKKLNIRKTWTNT